MFGNNNCTCMLLAHVTSCELFGIGLRLPSCLGSCDLHIPLHRVIACAIFLWFKGEGGVGGPISGLLEFA